MNYWTTKTGQKIAVEDLGDRHLLNILKILKRENPEELYGMRISRIDNNSSYSIEKNREQLNLILGEGAYITCAREKAKDDVRFVNSYDNEWDYILQS